MRAAVVCIGLISSVASGCLVGEAPPELPPADANDANDEPEPTGLVTEPAHGTVLVGDPASLSIHVAGLHDEEGEVLAVQVLANPDDLSSWETIGTAEASRRQGTKFRFSVDVRPVSADTTSTRWPRGGVLRLRVVDEDGRALTQDETDPSASVIAIANAAETPAGWTYLTTKPVGSVEETLAYYTAIDAPPTLDAFAERYGFPTGEASAIYYNVGDLGIGRDMHCRATTIPAGGLACISRNFGTFGGTRDEAFAAMTAGIPIATVVMLYTPPITAPNAVAFMVYGPDGTLVTEAQLDTHGDNTSIPQNCLNCHGARATYNTTTHAVTGARFLPFDPAAFDYYPRADLSFAAQETNLRQLNQLVRAAAPTEGIAEMLDGIFPVENTRYQPAFVPPGWTASARDAEVYREVIAPYCRSCHASFESGPLAFRAADDVRGLSGLVVTRLCGPGPIGMPVAEATAKHFFSSSARSVLLAWLDVPGACAPAIESPPAP